MRSIPPDARVLLYVVAGGLVGFLFLAEFALITFPLVQLAMFMLALVGFAGALRGRISLGLWSVFAAAAVVTPLLADSRIVGLPRCGEAAAGVACFAGTRDVDGQFAMELLIFFCGIVGALILAVRATSTSRRGPR